MKKLDFGWQTREEKIGRYINMPAKDKLEWLADMLNLVNKTWPKKQKKIFLKLRETR